MLGSIPLPSYKILFCTPRECKNRKFTFKVLLFGYSFSLRRKIIIIIIYVCALGLLRSFLTFDFKGRSDFI